MKIVEIENLSFSYSNGRKLFDGFNLSFDEGVMYSIIGKSGAGKTTLLSLLAALTRPASGQVRVKGENIFDKDTYRYRCSDIGIVFQNYNLLPKMDAIENVMLSMDISEKEYPDKKQHAIQLLERMGLEAEDMERPILQLSGGQQQRVAIARSLSYDPDVILADEPTGNLDPDTTEEILKIFKELAHDENKCVIIVTHSQAVADASDRVITIGAKRKTA